MSAAAPPAAVRLLTHTGTRRLQTFIPKIVSVPAQAVPLALLSFFGFVAPVKGVSQEQPEGVKLFIMVRRGVILSALVATCACLTPVFLRLVPAQFIFFVLPCFLAICSFFIKTRFPIKTAKLSEEIVKGAALHLKGQVAQDPLTGQYVGLFEYVARQVAAVWTLCGNRSLLAFDCVALCQAS